jgi:GT2 family glycosyltransferase/glycosyltransferase involved in cell wall biosynthesis
MTDFLIFVSLEDWDEVWRRNQFVCAKLVERNPKLKILFVQPALDVSNALRTGRFARLFQRRERTIGAHGRIVCTRGLKLLPNSWKWARKVNEWMLHRHLRGVARRLEFRRPVLWLNPHSAVHLADRMCERAVIYDITDDWTELTQSAALRQLTIAQDAELCGRADAVIVCSEKLLEKKQPLARNLHLVPNGVDAAHYARVLDATGPLPTEAASWPKPVFGYTGTIHPDRVEVELVEKIAREFPSGTVALVGPIMLSATDRDRLRACGNVAMTGAVAYERLPELMRAFDVCITPHRVTAFTESLNPIKLWEYLAAGKPIVSANVAGFRDYPQHVRVAVDHDDFIGKLREALVEDPAKSVARRAEVSGHSWQARAEQIETIIASVDGTRKFAAPALEISAIVVSYNTRKMTLECLRTLDAELHGSETEIIVVDNASQDGSVEAIRAEFPQVRVLASSTNDGFGAANNRAMKEARGRFFLLLNSDAFPRPGAIAKLVQYLEEHPDAGAVGPRLLNEDGTLQHSCFRFPTPRQSWVENLWIAALFPEHSWLGDYRRWGHDSARLVEWIVGACMLVRREVVEQVGGFDETFFLYAEETDWQRRIRDGGWEIAFTPSAEVTHLGGGSGASERVRVNGNFFDSLDRYERKHHGLAGLISLRCAMIVGCGLRAALWAITWLLRPQRRAQAGSKARLHSWLFLRQATHWR